LIVFFGLFAVLSGFALGVRFKRADFL